MSIFDQQKRLTVENEPCDFLKILAIWANSKKRL